MENNAPPKVTEMPRATEAPAKRRYLKPANQKSVYACFADVYEKLMNDEIEVEKAEQVCNALAGMNRTFALEIKKSEVEGKKIRVIEIKNFESDQAQLNASPEDANINPG